MSRRKLQWQRQARKVGKDAIHATLPAQRVKATGTRRYPQSKQQGSGVGQVVTLPMSERKRTLVEKWVREMK